MNIRIGKENEFDLLDDLLKQAATRLKNKGSEQWSHILEDAEQETLHFRLNNQEVLLFEENEQIAGMCYLYEEPNEWDADLWKHPKEDNHYYLHKVVISDAFVGQHYGEKMLLHLINWLEKQGGKRILLDCKADVTYLNTFYQKVGFQFIGSVKQADVPTLPSDFNLYEYKLNNN